MLANLTAFSATDTTKVCFPKETARKIAQELIAGDECRDVLALTQNTLSLSEKQLSLKDSIISYKDRQIASMDTIVRSQQSINTTMQQQYAHLQKQYKKQRRKSFLKSIGNVVLLAGVAALLIIK